MQITHLPVCNMGLFGISERHFYTCSLAELLESCPRLECSHKQDFNMLLYVECATGEITLDNHIIRLDGPKIIMIRPQTICRLEINGLAKGQVVCFTEEFFLLRYDENVRRRFAFMQHDKQPFVDLDSEQKSHWETLIDLLGVEYKLHRKESQKALHAYLNILLIEMERMISPLGFISVNRPRYEKIAQFERLIDQHYTEKRLPSAYADKLHITTNYLNKMCKEETGCTAGDLIRRRIMIEAQRLLHHTSLSVSEIADRLGFESVSYFVTFFKKYEDRSPEQYRHQIA